MCVELQRTSTIHFGLIQCLFRVRPLPFPGPTLTSFAPPSPCKAGKRNTAGAKQAATLLDLRLLSGLKLLGGYKHMATI